ncbi:hypothetical protein GNIT_3444 [Glaciecola nitratireducens FR1064]|uniref:Uncharacterized protein n=1 Tax=Glaciecola nitratireducens (strain JCM 12485 / KCTC 12276 / FR1064) TaxID=1085623 RepID=G4QNB9_GLANF|nr:hypothetical protein GNIT_3444 [Glaciecola nitratireducens FR1064]
MLHLWLQDVSCQFRCDLTEVLFICIHADLYNIEKAIEISYL